MKKNKDGRLNFRCTKDEELDTKKKAGEAGISVSSYLYRIVFNKKKLVLNPSKMLKELNSIGAELNKSGSNVNQVVKQINIQAKKGEVSNEAIEAFNSVLTEHNQLVEMTKSYYIKLLKTI